MNPLTRQVDPGECRRIVYKHTQSLTVYRAPYSYCALYPRSSSVGETPGSLCFMAAQMEAILFEGWHPLGFKTPAPKVLGREGSEKGIREDRETPLSTRARSLHSLLGMFTRWRHPIIGAPRDILRTETTESNQLSYSSHDKKELKSICHWNLCLSHPGLMPILRR